MTMDIREALSEAFDKSTSSTESEASPVVEQPAAGGPASSSATGDVSEGAGSGDGSADGAGPRPNGGGRERGADRERDEHGRFKPRAAASATEAPKPAKEATATQPPKEASAPAVAPPPTEGAPSATPPPQYKAPQSWKPAVREHFAKLPPEVQAEVIRLENETKAALRETAEPKKFHQAFQQAIAPFAPVLQARGVEPLQAVQAFFQTEARLRMGTPQERAQTMAQLIGQYGVDIAALDAALAGQPQPQGQTQAPTQGEYRDPRIDQLFQRIQTAQQTQHQQALQRAHQDINGFAEKNEFLDDVRPHMIAMFEAAKHSGEDLDLQEAYDRACWADKGIRAILQQRQAAEQAANAQASTQRAQVAAVSVKSQPSGPAPTGKKDIRGALEEAWAKKAAGR